MRMLLVAATAFEIAPFISLKKNTDILITGVGVPATLYHLQRKLMEQQYDAVIQAGIAGTFKNDIPLGTVVVVKKDCFADIGINEKGNFTSIFEAGFTKKNERPFTNGWLVNKNLLPKKLPLPVVTAVTINTISDSNKQKKMLVEKYHPQVESMEGAALHYVCLQQNIPFLQLRSISNKVGVRDKTKWVMKDAINNLNLELTKFFKTF